MSESEINIAKKLKKLLKKNKEDDFCLKAIEFISKYLKTILKEDEENSILPLFESIQEIENYQITNLDLSSKEIWINFVKVMLKYGLKSTKHPFQMHVIKTLRLLITPVYQSNESKADELQHIYDMIMGHSKFMPIMVNNLHLQSESKTQLALLISELITNNTKICNSNSFPIFLGSYHGTLSNSDCAVLKVLRLFIENNDALVAQFYPLMWGEKAVKHYSVNRPDEFGATAFWKRPQVSQVLSAINPYKMIQTSVKFPINLPLSLDEESSQLDNLNDYQKLSYDPRFFLPLFSQVCAPGMFVDRHLKLIENGVLALSLAALSSKDQDMRKAGYNVLARIYHQLETAKLTAEKQVWLHFIDLIRNGVKNSKGSSKLRLPSLVTVFMIRASEVLFSPLDKMYKTVSSFVLAKPSMDLFNVPEFFRLLHSKEPSHLKERNWILNIISDGMKDSIDFQIAQKYFVFKFIMAYSNSYLCDQTSRLKILNVVLNAVKLKQPAFELVKNHGLCLWLGEIWISTKDEEKQIVAEILDTVINVIINSVDCVSKLPSPIRNDFKVLNSYIKLSYDSIDEKTKSSLEKNMSQILCN